MSLADDILGLDDLDIEPVEVPEWKRTVHIKLMSGDVRGTWHEAWEKYKAEKKFSDSPPDSHWFAVHLVHVICDESGKLAFTMEHVPGLLKRSHGALERIYKASKKLNRLGGDEVENAAKN